MDKFITVIFERLTGFLKTPYGQNIVRVLFTTLGVSGMYLLVMSVAGEIIKLEHNARKKIKTKLVAKIISIIIGISISFSISIVFYNVNDRRLLIGQSMVYYFAGVAVFLAITSDKLKEIIRAIRGKNGGKNDT